MVKISVKCWLLIALMAVHTSVYAVGLGKLNVLSSLGQPLKAEIEVLSATPKELESLKGQIASFEAYAQQGLERPYSHRSIQVALSKNLVGKPVFKLSSTKPIDDAFLDMLIQVDWQSGRLLREYTVLLDPPGYKGEFDDGSSIASLPKAAPVQAKPLIQEKPVAAPLPKTPSQSVATAITKPTPTRKPKPKPQPAPAETEYLTKRGDTLYAVAKRMKPAGVSLEKMLVGLYQENPEAFSGDNMHRLKTGQILRAPSQATLNNLTKKTVNREIRVQTEDWQAYKNRLAGIVKEREFAESAGGGQSNTGKVVSAQEASDAKASGPKDVVKLSAGDAKAMQSLEDKVASLEEELTAKDNAVKEAESRTADLQAQIDNMQKLLALKSDAMTKVQQDAMAQNASKSQKPAPEADIINTAEMQTGEQPKESPEGANAEQAPVEQPATDGDAAKEAPTATQQAEANQPPAKADSAADTAAEQTKTKPTPTKPAPVKPVEEPSFLAYLNNMVESVTSNLGFNPLVLGVAAIALLAGAWLFVAGRRKKSLSSFEEGIMSTGGLKANTVFGNTAGGTVDTGDTSFLTDFSSISASSMIDSHDVDPIAEAEVYMAYGRDAQAEEILKDAMVKEPERYELHMKLLEIYQNNENAGAFETVATEMYTSLGSDDPKWHQVVEMGASFDPNNPLYATAEGVPESSPAAEQPNNTVVSEEVVSTDDVDALDSDESETMDMPASQNEETVSETVDTDQADDEMLSFDMDIPALDDESAENALEDELNIETQTSETQMPEIDTMAFVDTETETVETLAEEITLDETPAIDANDATLEMDTDTALEASMPTLDVDFDTAETVQTEEASEAIDEELPALSIETDELDSAGVEEISLDTVQADDAAPETGNGLDAITLDLSDNATDGNKPSKPAPATLDFSSIDLEMDSTSTNQSAVEDTVTPEALNGAEEVIDSPEDAGDDSADVETKLDLVEAYIDMEDKVGAKELLDEVASEGSARQQKRAAALMERVS